MWAVYPSITHIWHWKPEFFSTSQKWRSEHKKKGFQRPNRGVFYVGGVEKQPPYVGVSKN
jgi:hypothetical protein